jgi:2-iminobutanoate/2-iminopropanoate deaminase
MKKEINSDKISKAIGPYSHCVVAEGKFVFISGQIALNKEGELEGDTVKVQTQKSLEKLKLVVEEAGGTIDNIVKTTVLMTDLSYFNDMNEVYAEFFGSNKPARAAYQVSRLPKNALIEIEAIACL